MALDKEIKELLTLITKYYDSYPEHEFISQDEFRTFFDYHYPGSKKREDFLLTLDRIYALDTSDSIAADFLTKLVKKDFGTKLIDMLLPMLNDQVQDDVLDKVREQCDMYDDVLQSTDETTSPYVELSLKEILANKTTGGLHWPMDCLQDDLRNLTGNTLGHFFAIPDAGKTSFIHFLTAGLLPQLEGEETLTWFNNEEGGEKVKLRNYSAVCNATEDQIDAQPDRAEATYRERGGGRLLLFDQAIITIEEIERACIKNHSRFAIVDIGDKVVYRGKSSAGNGADALQGVYDNLREVVKRVNKTHKFDLLTTGQAGTTAENKKWLQQSDLYAGKTGKAGAFDYIIGMGWLQETPNRRYFGLCKNKLGTQSGRHVVAFDPLRARFKG